MQMLMMRDHGRRIPKSKLFGRQNWRHTGICIVREMQDIYNRRTMTIARLGDMPDADGGKLLYDARLIWFEAGTQNFMLTGIERQTEQGQEVEFAQSWLVYLDIAPPIPTSEIGQVPEGAKKMTDRELRRVNQIR